MTNEELLLEIEKIEKRNGLEPNSLLKQLQDIAKAYNTSLEEWVNGMPPILISVCQTKPIRIKETSCKNCKYYGCDRSKNCDHICDKWDISDFILEDLIEERSGV